MVSFLLRLQQNSCITVVAPIFYFIILSLNLLKRFHTWDLGLIRFFAIFNITSPLVALREDKYLSLSIGETHLYFKLKLKDYKANQKLKSFLQVIKNLNFKISNVKLLHSSVKIKMKISDYIILVRPKCSIIIWC